MKRILLLCHILLLGYLSACKPAAQQSTDGKHYGKTIDANGALSVGDLLAKMQTENLDTMPAKISGKVLEVCQAKGCWMTMEHPNGDMRVTFKDYAFFMPLDLAGKSVIAEGIAQTDTVSVEMLQHYAEDAGKSAEEIEQITEPEIEVSFIAEGVLIQ